MSRNTVDPQTPCVQRVFNYEILVDEAASPSSPSSSSRSSVVERPALDGSKEVLLLRQKDGVEPAQEGALALPPSFYLEKEGTGRKQDALSPFLVPIDLRRLSRSPLPSHRHHHSNPTYLISSSSAGHHSLFTKQHLHAKMLRFWTANRSYLLVIISTVFGSVMTLFAKILESGDHGMHPFQILFIRMAVSTIFCSTAVYLKKPSEFPCGPKGIRWLLVLRGVFGFFGICGIWTAISEPLRCRLLASLQLTCAA